MMQFQLSEDSCQAVRDTVVSEEVVHVSVDTVFLSWTYLILLLRSYMAVLS